MTAPAARTGCAPKASLPHSATAFPPDAGFPGARRSAGRRVGGDGRRWRLWWPGEAFRLSVDADRRENAGDPVHGVGLKLDMRW